MTSQDIHDAHKEGEPVMWSEAQVARVVGRHQLDQATADEVMDDILPHFTPLGVDAWQVLAALGY